MSPLRTNPSFQSTLRTLMAGALGVCLTSTPRFAHGDTVDRVVAVVEDDAIFLSDVQRRMQPFERQLQAQYTNTRERDAQRSHLYRETLDRMVDDALIRRAAQRAHVTVNDGDVDRMVDGMARQQGVAPADLYRTIESEGITRQEYRSFMESQVLRLRLMNVRVRSRVNVSEPDVTEEYRRQMRTMLDHAPFHAAHIFFAFPDNPTAAQVAATQQRAEAAVAQVRAGADFSQLASQLSDDVTTRERGGDLGEIDPDNEEAPPPEWLVDALRDLRPGQTSRAVRGENGYHVFHLIDRQAVNVPTLAQLHDQLFQAILQREMERQEREYLRELRQRSSVVVRP